MNTNARRVNATDIPGEDRRSLEHILGRKLQDEEQVYIMAYLPGVVPDEETRRKALLRLQERAQRVSEHVEKHGYNQQDIEQAIDDAAEHVRYGNS